MGYLVPVALFVQLVVWCLLVGFAYRNARGLSDVLFRGQKWVQCHRVGGWQDSMEPRFRAAAQRAAYILLGLLVLLPAVAVIRGCAGIE